MSNDTAAPAQAYHWSVDDQGIATVILDMPGRSANVLNHEFGEALGAILNQIQAEKESLNGVVLTSAKKTFIAGGDLDYLYAAEDPNQVFELAESFKEGLRNLETCGLPVVAGINGAALGGGLETALACHYRIAVDARSTKIGFPEVTLGLLPGGGGCVRTVRLMGLEKAAPFLLQGKQIPASAGIGAGFIHELASDYDDMIVKAKAWINSGPEAAQPWDQKKFRIPGGDPRNPRLLPTLSAMPALLMKETWNNYPAPKAILATMVEGATVNFETASRIESRYFAQLATGKVSKNMINAFWYQLNEINKGKSRPQGIDKQPTTKVGVLGAGMMGHGIAYVTAKAGMQVVMKDADQERADAGKAKIQAITDKLVGRGRMDAGKRDKILDNILPTGSADDLSDSDLIVEAVFENRDLKASVTKEAEAVISESAVFASNTSTLPITGLAEQSARPKQFVGLHFFSPVHKMRLVEIIRGKETDDATLSKAFDYVLGIGKVPIVVNDSRGFYTSRVFSTYTNEGLALLAEGQHPQGIESAGRQAGMPVGPLALMDEVSLKLALDIGRQTMKDMAESGEADNKLKMDNHPGFKVMEVMVDEYDRKGRAYGGGFYEYPESGKKHLWSELRNIFPAKPRLQQEMMIDRMLYAQAIETVRCVEEGVLTSVADANIGSIFGWGFAPWSGGTLQYINQTGPAKFLARARELAADFGPRFEPPQLLVEKGEKDEHFV